MECCSDSSCDVCPKIHLTAVDSGMKNNKVHINMKDMVELATSPRTSSLAIVGLEAVLLHSFFFFFFNLDNEVVDEADRHNFWYD